MENLNFLHAKLGMFVGDCLPLLMSEWVKHTMMWVYGG